ncbi:hypothetical protein POUND7_011473, partial [Theobroma cacao]
MSHQAAVTEACTSDQGSLGEGIQSNGLLKLTQTHPDLAGLKGQSNRRLFTYFDNIVCLRC